MGIIRMGMEEVEEIEGVRRVLIALISSRKDGGISALACKSDVRGNRRKKRERPWKSEAPPFQEPKSLAIPIGVLA